MSLSSDLISQFVKITKDEDKTKKETTVYGTARVRNGVTYVQIDGSELLTPVAESAGANDGERVTVLIKNHKAILNGNLDSPAARTGDVSSLDNSKLDINTANITYATIAQLNATNADVDELSADHAEFMNATAESFEAVNSKIQNLETKNFDAVYANIDFSNIGKAAMEYFYSQSGLIEDVVVGDMTLTGKLAGVTITGDLIEGNTVKADKLVIKGSDGLYYKLNTDGMKVEAEQTDENSINGSVIKAQSITATKISVDDLVAFDATIGGFNITEDSIYSGVKESVDNTTRGIYLASDGQIAIGDSSNFIKYYKDADGNFRLDISAKSVSLSTGVDLETELSDLRANSGNVEIGGRNLYLGTRNFDGDNWVSMEHWETWEGDYMGFKEYGRYGAWQGLHQRIPVVEGETYTFSFYATGNQNSDVGIYTDWDDLLTTPAHVNLGTIPDTHHRYSATFTANTNGTICLRVENTTDNGWIQICGLKVERGNKATDWTPAPEDIESGIESAKDDAEEAAKTATNFMSFDSDGLQIGNNTTGTWSGFRTQITSSAFNVLNAAGTVLASYGAKLVELGKNATDAIIKLCGGLGTIEYDSEDMYFQMSSDSIRLKGTEMASLYSQSNDKLGAVHAAPTEVQIVAGSGSSSGNVYVKPDQILLYANDIRTYGTITDTNTGGAYVSVLTGNEGIWTYRKYSNGDVELWGTYWITDQPCTTAIGGMYRTPAIVLDSFPFTVYDPFLTASYETNGYGALLWATTLTTNYDPPNYYLLRPVSGTISLGKINLHVRGRWTT